VKKDVSSARQSSKPFNVDDPEYEDMILSEALVLIELRANKFDKQPTKHGGGSRGGMECEMEEKTRADPERVRLSVTVFMLNLEVSTVYLL